MRRIWVTMIYNNLEIFIQKIYDSYFIIWIHQGMVLHSIKMHYFPLTFGKCFLFLQRNKEKKVGRSLTIKRRWSISNLILNFCQEKVHWAWLSVLTMWIWKSSDQFTTSCNPLSIKSLISLWYFQGFQISPEKGNWSIKLPKLRSLSLIFPESKE